MTKQKSEKLSKDKIRIAQHVLEVRHEASGTFLDIRGFVADYIKNNGFFPHWKIEANIVNFRDEANKVKRDGAFASYNRAGYFVNNPDTRNYFVDKASSYWMALVKNGHYELPKPVRFGCRTSVFIPTSKNFEKLNEIVFNAFYSEKARTFVGGRQTDMQFVFDLIEGQFNVNMSGGPFHEKEAIMHLDFESEHFDKCGLFISLDYFKNKDIDYSTVPKTIGEAIQMSWAKIETIANSLEI